MHAVLKVRNNHAMTTGVAENGEHQHNIQEDLDFDDEDLEILVKAYEFISCILFYRCVGRDEDCSLDSHCSVEGDPPIVQVIN